MTAFLSAKVTQTDANEAIVTARIEGTDASGTPSKIDPDPEFKLIRTGPTLTAVKDARNREGWTADDLAEYLVGRFADYAV